MSNILFVTTNYWPEPTGISIYTSDLAESLKQAGHSVFILTGLPHYPWWKIPNEYTHLAEGESKQNGIHIIRAKHFIPLRINALERIRFEISLWWNLRRVSKEYRTKQFDLVLACIPTVAAGIVGKRMAKILKANFGLIVQDLSGAGAKQSGMPGGHFTSIFTYAIEKKIYQAAHGIVVVSSAMRDVIIELGVESSLIHEILNYSARTIISEERHLARGKFGWTMDHFLVIHTGNMGLKQDLENVVAAAEKLQGDSQVIICLVGHGNQESKLKSLCNDKKNILIMAAVSDQDYSALLSAADLLLVNERITQMDMSLPSKLTSYLSSGRPILASVPPGGATWRFLDGIAELVEAGNPIALAQKIEELSKNPNRLKELADLGYKFAKENLDAKKGRQKYLDWVNDLLNLKSS